VALHVEVPSLEEGMDESFTADGSFVHPVTAVEDSLSEPETCNQALPQDVREVTFTLINGGSKRGKHKLVDSLGYSYTVKKRY
jgi:hypothetical protein